MTNMQSCFYSILWLSTCKKNPIFWMRISWRSNKRRWSGAFCNIFSLICHTELIVRTIYLFNDCCEHINLAAGWLRKNRKADKCWKDRFFRIDHDENSQGMHISFLCIFWFFSPSFLASTFFWYLTHFSWQKDSGAIGKQIEDGVRLMGRGAEHIKWPIHLEVLFVTLWYLSSLLSVDSETF